MIILDTNVISELMKEVPERAVVDWLDQQPQISVWTTAISVLECRFGIEMLASGRRRDALDTAFASLVEHDLSGRVLAFDQQDAEATAVLMASGQARGRPRDLRDSMIAGMVRVRHARLATRNLRHFERAGIDLIDPWAG